MEYFVVEGESESGPFSESRIKEMVRAGTLTSSGVVRRVGQNDVSIVGTLDFLKAPVPPTKSIPIDPPIPILAAIYYIFAGVGFVLTGVMVIANLSTPGTTLLAGVIGSFASFTLLGFAQVVTYLGRTAFYTEQMARNSRQ